MRFIFIITLMILMCSVLRSQTDYVPPENRVYAFLERMETLQIISDYNSFEIPKTRKEIAEYIEKVLQSANKLDEADKEFLGDLKIEFEYELFGTLENSESLINGGDYNPFSQKQKYLYFYDDPGNFNIFINLTGEGDLLLKNKFDPAGKSSAFLGIIGGELRSTILNKFGVFIKGTDGNVFGNREAAFLKSNLRFNYKFNEKTSETFFDETQGYLTADFNLVRLKYGRDRMNIGYGPAKIILGNDAPLFDYLGMNILYKFFSYTFFHAQLLGQEHYNQNAIAGTVNVVDSKYIAYHRIGFNLSNDINFGAGELIVYGERAIDLSYLNPFAFYKSLEHSNRDRDNAMLFLDFNNKSLEGLKFYATLLIDDISFDKLGTGWWGNQTILDAGVYSELLYKTLPLAVRFQYTKVDPYVYTHRLIRNNFTNFGYNLSSFTDPNTELFLTEINYRFNSRVGISFIYDFRIHGANPLNEDGAVKENVGGDISLGHRTFDSEHVSFLDGFKEYSRTYSLRVLYEPVNEYYLTLDMNYLNESLQTVKSRLLNTLLTLSIKI